MSYQPKKILSASFFNRSALIVARDLLGKYLVKKNKGKIHAYKITEVEAYCGPNDKASHAHKGRTARNETMYAPSGILYVYFVYGMHHMLNFFTRKKNFPSAVLIRGVEKISGPGRLTKALGITKKENNILAHPKKGTLWFEDRGEKILKKNIRRTARIGISYAKEWKDKPYRFLLIK